jgi:hydrogenase nickel incorporation protein HypA/HybF
MHEYSIARRLLEQVRDTARQHAATAVMEVVVAVGPLSGVEPILLHSAFQQLATGELLQLARLTIEQVPLAVRCDFCERLSTLNNFVFVCQHCGSSATRVVSGEDIVLKHVVLQVPVAEEAST